MHVTLWKKHEDAKNYIMRTIIIGTFRSVLLGQVSQTVFHGRIPIIICPIVRNPYREKFTSQKSRWRGAQ